MYFDHRTELVCPTSDEPCQGTDPTLCEAMSLLFNHILQNGDPIAIDPDLELLAMPFYDPESSHPGVLMSDPPMFFFILVLGTMDIITSLCRVLGSRVAGLLQLRDRKGRGPAHFAAAGRICMLFADILASYGCRELLMANALERDTYGLLPIHYASCMGSLDDVQFCIDCGSNYAALTDDVNEYSTLELALKSAEFDLAKWLLTETTVPWSELSPGAGICISGCPSVSEAEYSEIFSLLETSGIDPAMPRHGQNLLMHAIAEKVEFSDWRVCGTGTVSPLRCSLPYVTKLVDRRTSYSCKSSFNTGTSRLQLPMVRVIRYYGLPSQSLQSISSVCCFRDVGITLSGTTLRLWSPSPCGWDMRTSSTNSIRSFRCDSKSKIYQFGLPVPVMNGICRSSASGSSEV
jgi:hypothetical protein